jgi:hypothetical protein
MITHVNYRFNELHIVIDLLGLGAILRHSANCSVKRDLSASSLHNHSRFTSEDCYHEYHANWTQIKWAWSTDMRRLRLQGTQNSEWHSNIHLRNQTIEFIISNTFIIHYIRLLFSIHYMENVANYNLLFMLFFGYIILLFPINYKENVVNYNALSTIYFGFWFRIVHC